MNCPNCNSVLIKVERKNIEFEYCPECGGFFLDADEWYVIKCEFDLTSKIDDIMRVNSLTKIEEKAFYNCPNLDIVIDYSEYSIMVETDAFKGCKSVSWKK